MPNRPTNPYASVYQTFVEQTTDHRLLVEHELGVHRTLFVGAPGTGIWSWRVITSPGFLFIAGDIADGYSFSRVYDMLNFFDRTGDSRTGYYSDGSPSIDFRYWAEKLLSEQRGLAKEYSPEAFLSLVRDNLAENEHQEGSETWNETLDSARSCANEENLARQWLESNQDLVGSDAYWEASLNEYTMSFLLACYAIEHTVRLYREHQQKHSSRDDYILVEGGLVQNSPALPIYDLDVLDSDVVDSQTISELIDLYERILRHGDHRRPVEQELLDVLPRIRARLDPGLTSPEDLELLDEADKRYARRVERAKYIE